MSALDSYTQMAPIYDLVYLFKDYRKEARLIAAVVRKNATARPRTLLDVACGTGAHLEHLRASFEVEGLDLDRAMLRYARKRLPGVRLHQGDFTRFDLGKQYDAVVCLFSAICHANTIPKLNQAVAAMARHVAPGGVLAIEPWITPQSYVPGKAGVIQAEDDRFRIVRMSFVERTGKRRMRTEFHYLIRSPRRVRYFKESFATGLYTDAEYRAAFRRAGLKARNVGKGPTGRGLYVATKPRP